MANKAHRSIEALGFKLVYVDGGFTANSFFKKGLIDKITIMLILVILDECIALFMPQQRYAALKHIDTTILDLRRLSIKLQNENRYCPRLNCMSAVDHK